ncbi:MAG: DNA recombination protein RmuC, partial [Bdellovibrionales bacterium]|nr:DNA recombination protein RmuC [Bdellovibrionales bacterium]
MDPFSLIIVCVAIIAIASMGFLFIRASTVEKGKLQQASSQVASLAARLEEKERRIGELTSTNTELQGELSRLHAESSSLQTERKLLEERIRTHEEDLRKLHERTRVEFENLAHKIFDEKTKSFKSQSSESLTQLLNPLSEHLKGFQKTVQESFSEETRERFSLKREIERICALNEKMTVETGNLAQALKGDVKTQGTWGEMMLERILEDSGLREGEDYILQGAGLKLRHPESGSASKPDAIVMLPQGKHIIIDSKVSLEHYRRLLSEEEDGQRELALKDYLNSIRQHVVGLESRRYQDIDGLQTPDFVFMFMPIEAA